MRPGHPRRQRSQVVERWNYYVSAGRTEVETNLFESARLRVDPSFSDLIPAYVANNLIVCPWVARVGGGERRSGRDTLWRLRTVSFDSERKTEDLTQARGNSKSEGGVRRAVQVAD